MGFLSHRVGRDKIEAGDHIYTWRNAYAYSHHGVYIGENMVVHFTHEAIPNLSGGIFAASSSKIALSSYNFSASCSKNLPGCPIMPDSSSKIEVPTLNSSASCSQNLPACPIMPDSSSKIEVPTLNSSASCSQNLPGCPIMPNSSSKIEVPTLNSSASCSQNLPAYPIMPDSSSKIEVSTLNSSASCSQNLPACPIMPDSSSKIEVPTLNSSASCSQNLPACPIMPDSSSKIEVPPLTASFSQNLPACLECGFRKSESGVMLSCLDCFLAGGSLHRFEYGVSSPVYLVKRAGTCTTAKSDAPEVVIRRAMYLLHNGFGNYSVVENNCEDFALYCKTSLLIHGQGASGRSGQVSSIKHTWDAVTRSSSLQLFMSSPIGIATAGIGFYSWSRYASDIGVRSDVVKVELEDVASFRCSKGPKKHTTDDVQCRNVNVDFSAFAVNMVLD